MADEFPQIILLAQAEDEHAGEDAAPGVEDGDQAGGELHTETGVADEHSGSATFPPFDSSTFGTQLIWLALTFGVLYLLMSKVTLPRIGEILEVRRDRIEGDLAEAERLRQKTEQAQLDYENALAEARKKAHGMAEKTRGEIKADIDAKRAKVEADIAKKVNAAESRIQKTKDEALKNVDEIAAETAVALVGRISGRVSIKSARDAVAQLVKG